MKKIIFTLILGAVLLTTPVETKAFTQPQANAYFRGINKLNNIQKVCDLNGYRSNLVDFNACALYGQPNAYGITDLDNKLIFVRTNQSNEYIERSIIHEYAHALSRIGNLHINGVEDILYTEMPFMVAYKVDPYDSRSTYCMASKDEYFAEALVEYYFHPKQLQLYCPITYNYIKQVNIMFNGK